MQYEKEKTQVGGRKMKMLSEMNEVLNQLLMIYQLLMSYQNTDEVLNTGENIDETTTDEVADEAFNANVNGRKLF